MVSKVWKEASEEELWKALEQGVKAVLEHGDFGEVSPAGAARFEVKEELLNRGYSEDEINKKVYEMINGK